MKESSFLNGVMEGVVVEAADYEENGRTKVWVPALDGDSYNPESLPPATYLAPFGGQVNDARAGRSGDVTEGLLSYGMWCPPALGAIVAVTCMHGDPNMRVVIGALYRSHSNRSLPNGRNAGAPTADTGAAIQPSKKNLLAQFRNNLSASEAITRGVRERTAGSDKASGDIDGYAKDGNFPQRKNGDQRYVNTVYSMTTPGHHTILMNDAAENCRVRFKTTAGHQIILDDTNERIYVSTAMGKSWIELDEDGRIHAYAEGDFALSTGGSLNLSAVGDVNIAGATVNIVSSEDMRITACGDAHFSAGGSLNLQSGNTLDLLAAAAVTVTGTTIDLNGPGASSADSATAPSIIPTHEPWQRPATKGTRNPLWKP